MLDYMTHQVLVYQVSGEGSYRKPCMRVFLNELLMHIYSYPGKRRSLGEEDWSDFLLQFYERIPELLMKFRYQGLSFMAYLDKVLQWHIHTYYRESLLERYGQWVCERESILEYGLTYSAYSPHSSDLSDSLPLYGKIVHLLGCSKMSSFRVGALRRRLLILVFKNVAILSEDDFLSVFPFLGLEAQKALHYRGELFKTMEKRFAKRRSLKKKRQNSYYRMFIYEKQRQELRDPEQLAVVEERILMYKERLRHLEHQILTIPLTPSNEKIASVLGIPKGTVDSSLYYLRNYLRNIGPSCRESFSMLRF
jgi:hypothetical protein